MRALTILFAIGFIIGSIFFTMAASYALAGLAEAYLFKGAAHIVNVVTLMLVFVMVIATLLTLAERKWSALMQNRVGPNRARINLPGVRNRSLGGLPHIASDVLKMLTKEDFIPRTANRILFNLGPVLAFAPVFALFAIVPAGPTIPMSFSPGGQAQTFSVPMVVATPDFGLLYVFAIASLAVYGTSLAGWSSNNKLALLGGVRASSQMISYEISLGLSLVGMMLAFSTIQLATDPAVAAQPSLVDAQSEYLWRFSTGGFDLGIPKWGIFLQPFGFIAFFAAAFAETKRAPFDMPEGESEIIGYFVEYSGMKFGMFMISEFVEIVVLAGVTASVFFGGYHLPFGEAWLANLPFFRDNTWAFGALLGTAFWIKVIVLCWVQLLIRWTFPRFRYDQIQTLGWKMLLPIGVANVFITGALVLFDPSLRALAIFGFIELGVMLALTLSSGKGEARGEASAHGAHDAHHAPSHAPAPSPH